MLSSRAHVKLCFLWILSCRKKNNVQEQMDEKWPNTEKPHETFVVSKEEQRPSANATVQCSSSIGNMHLAEKVSVLGVISS